VYKENLASPGGVPPVTHQRDGEEEKKGWRTEAASSFYKHEDPGDRGKTAEEEVTID
jgi:hypothetical protein